MSAGVRKTSVRNCPAVHRPAFRRVPIGGRQKTITRGETQRCAATLEDMTDRVVIAGGGIAGLATAAALTQCEIPVTVLEKSDVLRQEGTTILLQANGWRVLDVLSIGEELRKNLAPLKHVRLFTGACDVLNATPLGDIRGVAELRGILRKKLLQKLADILPEDSIQFESAVASVDLADTNRPVLRLEDGREIRCRVLVGAEGVGSKTASALGLSPPVYQGICAIRGVSEFKDALPFPRESFCFYLGDGARAGMFQVEDLKAYWFITYLAPKDTRIANAEALLEETKRRAEQFRGPVHDCIENLLPGALNFAKPSDRILPPFVTPGKGNVVLVGDSYHPMTPHVAQGGAMALEDTIVLARHLAAVGGLKTDDVTLSKALRGYERERWKRVMEVGFKSRVAGMISALPASPIATFRNALITRMNMGQVLLSTARYDCGTLRASKTS